MENYRESCKPHFNNNITRDDEEHLGLQNVINAHATMRIGITKTRQETAAATSDMVKNNLLVENHGLAPINGMRRDHKPMDEDNVGPPVIPVCGGNAAYNSKFSPLTSMVITNIHK